MAQLRGEALTNGSAKVKLRMDILHPSAVKGIVPLCGCRKPKQVRELAEAANVVLRDEEISRLESAADKSAAKIMGPDLFRPFVKKDRGTKTK